MMQQQRTHNSSCPRPIHCRIRQRNQQQRFIRQARLLATTAATRVPNARHASFITRLSCQPVGQEGGPNAAEIRKHSCFHIQQSKSYHRLLRCLRLLPPPLRARTRTLFLHGEVGGLVGDDRTVFPPLPGMKFKRPRIEGTPLGTSYIGHSRM
ncbi:unnamed protein product, partial [Ectocarpus sp. 12 AP-2014]